MVFTFWEGKMPAYIKMCMNTWHFPYMVLNFDTLKQYTKIDEDFIADKLLKLTLPQIADWVRVHVLRDCGGYWLDTDTIMLSDKLPEETILGFPKTKGVTIGFLHTEPHTDMFKEWAKYQDNTLAKDETPKGWDVMGNRFVDKYVKEHDVSIGDISRRWAETYMITEDIKRSLAYHRFYFERNYHLSDLLETDMLMLHNSWTPPWYKVLNEKRILNMDCTMSNILKEVL